MADSEKTIVVRRGMCLHMPGRGEPVALLHSYRAGHVKTRAAAKKKTAGRVTDRTTAKKKN